MDIAVDANRDGVVEFGKDKTTSEKPFRFWINDDDDRDDKDHPGSSTQDKANNTIESKRDLEDFTRLHINIGGLQDAIVAGTIQVGLEWKDVTSGGAPAIKVYTAIDQNAEGGDDYLKTEEGAENQMINSTAIGTVASGSSFKFPTSFWQDNLDIGQIALSAESPNRYLIFEGSGEGKGRLVLTFWKGTEKIGEGGDVWLDLLDVRKMYSRGYSQENIAWKKPNEYNPYQSPVVSIAPLDQVAFVQPADESKDTIVFVHGIHAIGIFTEQSAISTYTNVASTVFKRLWWQGFKGRFGFYKWKAHHLSQFNESEYRGWKCGRGLAAFLNQLPGENKNVWTFSQGAVVGSAAIRDYGATPNKMIIMQSAIPAVVYDDDAGLNIYSNNMPDTVADLGYRGYHQSTGTEIVNFADPTDPATGVAWRGAQDFKPESPGYDYNSTLPNGQQHTVYTSIFGERFVTDLHESLSMIARSKSRSIAYEPGARGVISKKINLNVQFGFTAEHGAAFERSIQKNLNEFYDEVMFQFKIPYNE